MYFFTIYVIAMLIILILQVTDILGEFIPSLNSDQLYTDTTIPIKVYYILKVILAVVFSPLVLIYFVYVTTWKK